MFFNHFDSTQTFALVHRTKLGTEEESYVYDIQNPLGFTDDLQAAEDMAKILNLSQAETIGDCIMTNNSSKIVVVCNACSNRGANYLHEWLEYWAELGRAVFGLPKYSAINLAHFKLEFDDAKHIIPKPFPRDTAQEKVATPRERRDY